MLYKKKGTPQESEIVICTVTKVQYHSVFVNLDEYERKSAMLHISEISPGRIRNINDYVKQGKVIICKILQINKEKGHIDVSLRRVTESQRREKMDLIKQEQKSEKIVEFVAKETKEDFKKLYATIMKKIENNYDFLHEIFNDIANQIYETKDIGLNKKVTDMLDETIKLRIKPAEVEIKAKLHIESYASNGIEQIKKLLSKFVKESKDIMKIHYLGGGNYAIHLTGEEYEELEKPYKFMKKTLEELESKEFAYKLQRT